MKRLSRKQKRILQSLENLIFGGVKAMGDTLGKMCKYKKRIRLKRNKMLKKCIFISNKGNLFILFPASNFFLNNMSRKNKLSFEEIDI